ncbi:DUF3108 domain-containing protein [Williamwhitmania taraxaci]|uniref:DUF3108 domain-containing protein n=1 Tax=Williamwhitmania taraxaci TaxID=1640674 RepID=A0A1G6Q2H7_9BACT|nr:DUF3108 domain-containing protein [Williamwhitmania taraxaci]SDC86563.1 Protein of unknown function [Williamwhitmania taraxaci]
MAIKSKPVLVFISVFIWFLPIQAQTIDSLNATFQVGETLRYNLSYGFLDVGTATLRVYLGNNGDSPAYYVRAEAKTNPVSGKLFNIFDVYESYIDITTGLPIKAIRDIAENRYRYYNEVVFMRNTKEVFSSKTGVHAVPDSVLDILSAFYYARRFSMTKVKENQKVGFVTYFPDEVFHFDMIYKGLEMVKSHFGWVECQKFVPIVETGRLFRKKDAVVIYITNDNNRLPIKIEMRMIFSSVEIELTEFYGIVNSLPVYRSKRKPNSEKNMPVFLRSSEDVGKLSD